MFDDSDDEFEDDYTESSNLINELKLQLNPKPIPVQKVFASPNQSARENKPKATAVNQAQFMSNTSQSTSQGSSNSTMRTRYSNRLKVTTESQKQEPLFENNETIEVLMEDMDEDTGIEYVLADNAFESAEEISKIMEDEQDTFLLPTITKTEDASNSSDSDESIELKSVDDDDDETGK